MTISIMSLQDSSQSVNSDDPIYDAPWRHLDRCSCGCFVSPKTGICNNKRCQHHSQRVADPKPWPPPGIIFTTRPELIGTPVITDPEPEAIQDDQQPEIDWARIEALEPRIRAATINVAQITGGDADDLFANARLAIIERALEESRFLSQADAYIVNFGVWRARDRHRHENLCPTEPIEDIPLLTTFDPDTSLMIAALPKPQRELVQLFFTCGEDRLIRGGRINVKRLAQELGISWRQANNRLRSLRQSLAWQGMS